MKRSTATAIFKVLDLAAVAVSVVLGTKMYGLLQGCMAVIRKDETAVGGEMLLAMVFALSIWYLMDWGLDKAWEWLES